LLRDPLTECTVTADKEKRIGIETVSVESFAYVSFCFKKHTPL